MMVRRYLTRSAVRQSLKTGNLEPEVVEKSSVKVKGSRSRAKDVRVTKADPRSNDVTQEKRKRKRKSGPKMTSDNGLGILNLGPDELEKICGYLDTQSALNLTMACKNIHDKLYECSGFWYKLCHKENFNDYTALKQENNEDEEEDSDTSDLEESKPKVRRRISKSRYLKNKRLCYNGEVFHDIKVPQSSPFWRKVFLRGLAMRRNLCQGRFEMWRLFLTDHDSLPVKKMMHDTSFRELRSSHRNSRLNQRQRRVRIHRYWTEDYMVALQHRPGSTFNDIFVWQWDECQNPAFLYTHNLYPEYPNGLFPTAFFLWKKYLVLLPDTGYIREERNLKSIIRAHDLSDNMKLAGSYDLPGQRRRGGRSATLPPTEAAHLHKLGDKAVALCRTPNFTLFVFRLPDCQLLTEVNLNLSLQRPLEEDDLDQRFLMRCNTMYFMFHPTHFFEEEDDFEAPAHGRLLAVNFENFAKDKSIVMTVDEKFDNPYDYIEKVSVIAKDRLACILVSGKVVIKDIVKATANTCTTITRFVIPCPEPLFAHPDLTHGDTDGPTMSISRDGDMILVMQQFEDGRKIYAYNVKSEWRQLYSIDLDNQMGYCLNKDPGYVSIDMDGNFVCAADLEKIVVWNSKTGRYIRTIFIPKHYNVRDDPNEMIDRFCWKGHTDFAFAEDGIVIVHSQRDFPVAADILLFW